MCRTFIKVDSDTIADGERRWSFIDICEVNNDEYLVELDEIFVGAFENLIKNRL
jgi:hypothetical protein